MNRERLPHPLLQLVGMVAFIGAMLLLASLSPQPAHDPHSPDFHLDAGR